MVKLKGLSSGEEAAQDFEEALENDPSLRAEVEKHMNSIIDIARQRKKLVFTKDDLNNYLKKKHNPPPPPGTDTCFSEPPGL